MAKRMERELDEYLDARKKGEAFSVKQFLDRIIPKRKVKVKMPEDVEVYGEDKRPKKKGVLSKVFVSKKVEEELIRAKLGAQDAVDDMKQIAKIALGMIRELPEVQLKKFRESSEFEQLKRTLQKYELIK